MATEYDVQAKLTVDARRAAQGADSLADRLTDLQTRVRGTQSAMSGMVRNAMGMAAAYVGFSAVSGMTKSLTRSTLGYSASLEKAKIGLGSVIASVEGLDFAGGMKAAEDSFQRIVKLSEASPAGPAEMFEIFQGILSPMRAAGQSMDAIYASTSNAVLAASALGVDLEQAQRDMVMMAQGTAGMDVKLFTALRNANAITENTEQWNKMGAPERIAKLQAALAKFQDSGKAFGNSWEGAMSTFIGKVKEIGRSAFSPVFERLKKSLVTINSYLAEHAELIRGIGDRLGMAGADMIGRVLDKAEAGFKWVLENWDTVAARFDQAMEVLQKYGPTLAKVAAGMAAADMVRGVAGGALGAASGAASLATTIGGALGVGSAGAGAAAGAAGGAAGAGAAGAGLVAALGPAAAILGLVAAAGLAIVKNWDPLVEFFGGTVSNIGTLLTENLTALWGIVQPLLETVGTLLLMVLVPAFGALLKVWEASLRAIKPFLKILGAVAKALSWAASEIFEMFLDALSGLVDWISPVADGFSAMIEPLERLATAIGDFVDDAIRRSEALEQEAAKKRFEEQEDPLGLGLRTKRGSFGELPMRGTFINSTTGTTETKDKKQVPGGRGGTTVNVEKMVIKQDFKNQDPSRVVRQMIHDITKQAENRVSSRFQGALTR